MMYSGNLYFGQDSSRYCGKTLIKSDNSLHAYSELKRIRESMTENMEENQLKEVLKFFVDHGNRKLSTEEKGAIKLAIDQANSLNELLQVLFASLTIDAHR